MIEAARRIDPLRAELPEFSVDWRFLLPVRAHARILLLSDTWLASSAYFASLGLEVVRCHMAGGQPHGRQHEREQADVEQGYCVVAHIAEPPFAAASFDAVVIPFGIPKALLGFSSGTDPFHRLKRLLLPGGALLLGFSNPWGILRRGPQLGVAMTPASIRQRLQQAGFGRFNLYAAVPNLEKPAYILPLRKRPLQFFLRHRFLGRRGGELLRIFPASLLSRLVPGLLPCYFLLAGA